jgi:N-acetylglucosaminyl-diphospho-decaprenol L-rhamnosyltransferase
MSQERASSIPTGSAAELDLAVVIVTWNVRDLVADALRTLCDDLSQSGLNAKVYVVDSASSDDTVDVIRAQFPQVELIASQENVGFSKGNNLALRAAGFSEGSTRAPRAAYLLNPDTLTHPGATRALFDALMSDPAVGLVGATLSYGDGSFQHSAFAFPGLRQLWAELLPLPGRFIEGRFNGRYPRWLYEQGKPFTVDFVLGAAMMVKRDIIEKTGMFDEQFFMYCEEIDWAWRIQKAGWLAQCVPSAHVTHLGGQSSGQVRPQSLIRLWSSRLLLARKHYARWKRLLARRLIAFGMWRRARKETNDELRQAYEHIRATALGKVLLTQIGLNSNP